MSGTENRLVVIEQAAVALLCEVKAAGLDLENLAKKARNGIMGNKKGYGVPADFGLKIASVDAVTYLVKSVMKA